MSALALPIPRPAIDPLAFNEAAAHLAGAVAVVAWGSADPRGLLVHTVGVLSAKPPRILFAVDKADGAHDALLREQECSVSLLAGEDQAEAESFTRTDIEGRPFRSDRWILTDTAPPRLSESLGHFAGLIDQRIDAGSHSLFVIRVSMAETRHCKPLVYFDHGFRQLQA